MAAVLKPTPKLKGDFAKTFVNSLKKPNIRNKDFLIDCMSIKKRGK